MAFIGIFDIIGPNMVGPSSSHTAGALSIASISRKIFGKEISNVKFTLYGSFEKTYKGHGTDVALLGGVLGFSSENLNIKNSFKIADEKGLNYKFEKKNTKEIPHPNTVDIYMEDKEGNNLKVRGVSIGGGKAKIVKINEIDLEFYGEYPTLIINHRDTRGVIHLITSFLDQLNLNIAFMNVYRDEKEKNANTIIELDDKVSLEDINILKENKDINDILLVQI